LTKVVLLFETVRKPGGNSNIQKNSEVSESQNICICMVKTRIAYCCQGLVDLWLVPHWWTYMNIVRADAMTSVLSISTTLTPCRKMFHSRFITPQVTSPGPRVIISCHGRGDMQDLSEFKLRIKSMRSAWDLRAE